VQVIDDQHDRTPSSQVFEDAEDELEQPTLGGGAGQGRAGGVAGTELGQEKAQLGPKASNRLFECGAPRPADQAAQGVDHRPVGQAAVAQVDAAATQHRGSCITGAPVQELRHQPGLSDPALPAHDQRRRLARHRPGQGVVQPGQLFGPAHELETRP